MNLLVSELYVVFPNIESSNSFEVVESGRTWVKAGGFKGKNPFTQRMVRQAVDIRLHSERASLFSKVPTLLLIFFFLIKSTFNMSDVQWRNDTERGELKH